MKIYTKSINISFIFFVSFSFFLYAQAPEYKWVKSFGGTGTDYPDAITAYSNGYYLTGEFTGTVSFGSSLSMTSKGNVDYFIVKYDSSGNAIWGKSGGGTLTDRGWGVAVDKLGNVITTGCYYGSATFDTKTLVSAGNLDAFTAKYDSSGNLLWIKDGKSVSQTQTQAIGVDALNNVYVAGYFGSSTVNTVTFDSITITSNGQRDILIAKFDKDGNIKWVINAGGSSSGEEAKDIAVDVDGNVYVTGMYVDTAYFGSSKLVSYGGQEIFIAKYNTNGQLIWAKTAGSSKNDDIGYGVALDNLGHLYVGGAFDSTAKFGNYSATTSDTQDVFITKMDTAGNFLWVKEFGGPGNDYCKNLKVDAEGNCIASGLMANTVTFGSTQLTGKGGSDIFILKLDSEGNVLWAKQAGGVGNDAPRQVAISGDGFIYASGYFNSTAYFDNTTITSAGGADMFVCKLVSTPKVVPVELVSFKGLAESGKVILSWSTATETNNSGFALERSSDNSAFAKIGFVKGNGTTTERTDYSFIDENISASKYYYRLKQIDFDGTFKYSSIVEVSLNAPGRFNLYQNYPNPFNPATSIAFDLPVASQVSIKIYNCLGKEIDILSNKDFLAGRSEVKFDASGFASGVYFYKVEAFGNDGSSFSSIRKMIIMK